MKLLAVEVKDVDMNGLRNLGDQLKEKLGDGVVLIASTLDGKVSLMASVTDGAMKKGAHAGNLIKAIAGLVGGGGGGRRVHLRTGHGPMLLRTAALCGGGGTHRQRRMGHSPLAGPGVPHAGVRVQGHGAGAARTVSGRGHRGRRGPCGGGRIPPAVRQRWTRRTGGSLSGAEGRNPCGSTVCAAAGAAQRVGTRGEERRNPGRMRKKTVQQA